MKSERGEQHRAMEIEKRVHERAISPGKDMLEPPVADFGFVRLS